MATAIAKVPTKHHFEYARETIVDAVIDAGLGATPERVAEATGYSPEQVNEVLTSHRFRIQFRRRLVQRGFTADRVRERLNEIGDIISNEIYRRIKMPSVLQNTAPEKLLSWWETAEKISAMRYQSEGMARSQKADAKRMMNKREALSRLSGSTAGQLFLAKKGLQPPPPLPEPEAEEAVAEPDGNQEQHS